MPTIQLTTVIQAPPQVVFNLSRSINLHMESMAHTNETAISGVTHGLIQLGETVTWRAKHLFKTRMLQVKITAMQPYTSFTDAMVKGSFKSMRHHHYFKQQPDGSTLMSDDFYFQSPYGLLGNMANWLFLTGYMRRLLTTRNAVIKHYAETGRWKTVL